MQIVATESVRSCRNIGAQTEVELTDTGVHIMLSILVYEYAIDNLVTKMTFYTGLPKKGHFML